MESQTHTTAPQVPVNKGGRPFLTEFSPLTERQEKYARQMALGLSYSEAFRRAGLKAASPGSMCRQIDDLNMAPQVQRRIDELRAKAADKPDILADIEKRRRWLRLVMTADPSKIYRMKVKPCDLCWPAEEVAKAYSAHFSADPFDPRPELPDIVQPRPDCKHCDGGGIGRALLKPSDEWGEAERAMLISMEQDEKGVIKFKWYDKERAADMLNRLDALYVAKSLNINANVNVASARDVDPTQGLALFERFTAEDDKYLPPDLR